MDYDVYHNDWTHIDAQLKIHISMHYMGGWMGGGAYITIQCNQLFYIFILFTAYIVCTLTKLIAYVHSSTQDY